MTNTRKNRDKKRKNNTRRRIISDGLPLLKKVKVGHLVYASKKYKGDEIITYTREMEKKKGTRCLLETISWFGSLHVAKLYASYSTKIYKWRVFKPFALVVVGGPENAGFFDKVFRNYDGPGQLVSLVSDASIQQLKRFGLVDGHHPYLDMSVNERCLYEFKFVFGYLTLREQYQFLLLYSYFSAKFANIADYGASLVKVYASMKYFELNAAGVDDLGTGNRISFYEIDKHVVSNFCKCVDGMGYEGLYQRKNIRSFWYPSFIKYSKDMEEYILFNPSRVLFHL
jgi:hypothetical protein